MPTPIPPPPAETARAVPLGEATAQGSYQSSQVSCQTSSTLTPVGEIVVVRVFGDVEVATEHVLRAALAEAGARRPTHVVVDVAGMGFCSVRGLALLVEGPGGPAAPRVEYLLSGVDRTVERYLGLVWPPEAVPVRYPSAGAAVLAAMTQQRGRTGPDDRRGARPPDGDVLTSPLGTASPVGRVCAIVDVDQPHAAGQVGKRVDHDR